MGSKATLCTSRKSTAPQWLGLFLTLALLCPGAGRAHTPPSSPARQQVDTDPLNRTPEVRDAFDHFYNMDYDGALTRFEHVASAHPHNPLATDYLLDTIIFRELNRLDLLDTTFYTNDGFLTGKHTVVEDPSVRDRVRQLAGEAVAEADARLAQNSEDVNALYARAGRTGLRRPTWPWSNEALYLRCTWRSTRAATMSKLCAWTQTISTQTWSPALISM